MCDAVGKLCVFPLSADIVSGEQVGAGLVTIVVPETVIKSEWGMKALQMLGGKVSVLELPRGCLPSGFLPTRLPACPLACPPACLRARLPVYIEGLVVAL